MDNLKQSRGSFVAVNTSPQLASIFNADIAQVRSRMEKLINHADAQLKDCSQRLIDRIAHPNWSVEWNLPRWLGSRFEIPESEQSKLVLANAFGLGHVRLRDDRVDSEIPKRQLETSQHLERLLIAEARKTLECLIDNHSSFWTYYDDYLRRWHTATLPMKAVTTFTISDLEEVANAGAPLYIVCAAVNTLSPSSPSLEVLLHPVRSYLSAAVLYDHLKDWRSDLEAGRPNLFVYTMLGEVKAGDMNPSIAKMRLEFLRLNRVVMYCETIYESLSQAAASAQSVGLLQFAQHLKALEGEARSSAKRMLQGLRQFIQNAIVFS
jgi:hypothetical protein